MIDLKSNTSYNQDNELNDELIKCSNEFVISKIAFWETELDNLCQTANVAE